MTVNNLDPTFQLLAFYKDDHSIIIFLIRLTVMVLFFAYILQPTQTMTLVFLMKILTTFELLRNLHRISLDDQGLKMYSWLKIICQVSHVAEMIVSTVTLLFGGSLIVLAVPFVFIGIKHNDQSLILIGGPLMCLTSIIIQLVLYLQPLIYVSSNEILRKWKCEANRMAHSQKMFYKRVVNARLPVSLPVLNIGIYDDQIRLNYNKHLLGYCVDLTITMNQMMN